MKYAVNIYFHGICNDDYKFKFCFYKILYRRNRKPCHRLNGPAIEKLNGTKHWFINGILYLNEMDFLKKVANT